MARWVSCEQGWSAIQVALDFIKIILFQLRALRVFLQHAKPFHIRVIRRYVL